jgi:hypothetical protein
VSYQYFQRLKVATHVVEIVENTGCVVIHTVEVIGSNPIAPTIVFMGLEQVP